MTNCSIVLLLVVSAGLASPAIAQRSYDITTHQPAQLNGIEYGYTIRNECKKEVTNMGTFRRYELTVYVTNKSGTTRVFNPRHTTFGTRDQDLLARFDCTNATGARLTSKTTTVRARPMSASYTASTTHSEAKDIASTLHVQAGHLLETGETISNTLVVIVPDGEQPQMRVRILAPETENSR